MDYVQVIIWRQQVKMTKIELELILDPDMYILFEIGTRDRIFYISNTYSSTSNKYIKFYDPKQGSKHITYLDPNNFGYAMIMQCLNFFQQVDSNG